jgi:chromosome segregation ATPase
MMQVKRPSLDERIVQAFADGATSVNVAAVISEAEAAAVAARETAEQTRVKALDPRLSAGAVADARRAMEDARFRLARLETALQQLADRLEEVRADEENERRKAAYNAVKAERDGLAEELARVYPTIASQLSELLTRLDVNDREVERVNRQLPWSSERLRDAELVARGLNGSIKDGEEVPRLVRSVRLPTFQWSPQNRNIWPRPS